MVNLQQLSSDPGSSLDFVSDLALLGASAIWGIGISQTFRFCIRAGRESRKLQAFVAWLCVADTLRQIFTIYSAITIYFNTSALFVNEVSPGCVIMPYLCSALVAGSAQSFFAYRLWKLSRVKWFIPVLTAPAVLFQLSIPLIYFRAITSGVVSGETQKDLLITTLIVGAVIDILLSAGLCSLLWGHFITLGPSLRPTKAMLQRMMLFSINTGMWTALLASSIIVVFFRTLTTDFMIFGYFHLLSPLYFATVLANLNARQYIKGTGDNVDLSPTGTDLRNGMRFASRDDDRSISMPRAGSLSVPGWRLGVDNASAEVLNPHPGFYARRDVSFDVDLDD